MINISYIVVLRHIFIDPVFQATVYLEIEFAVNPILRRRSEACRREAIYLAAG